MYRLQTKAGNFSPKIIHIVKHTHMTINNIDTKPFADRLERAYRIADWIFFDLGRKEQGQSICIFVYLSVEFADCTKIYYDFFLCVHRGRFISNIFDVVHACFSCEFVVIGVFFANNVYAVKKNAQRDYDKYF